MAEMASTRTSDAMLTGAYVGKINYLMQSISDMPMLRLVHDFDNIEFMSNIINSIHDKQHVCPNDICERNTDVKVTSILYPIAPLAFADIYGLHGHDLDDVVRQVVSVVNDTDAVKNLCVEYVHLLHDILWGKIDKDGILDILPELDVLESEVVCSMQENDIFFAALWSFIHSDDFESCYERASTLVNTNSDIVGVACTIAGLYYGENSIPTDMALKVMDNNFGDRIMTFL